jgi:hypothetical protein
MNAVQALEAACHRLVNDPRDGLSRALLLEALANFKSVSLSCFPVAVFYLVKISHDRADALSDRILESNSLSDSSIEDEIGGLCHAVDSLVAELELVRIDGDAAPVARLGEPACPRAGPGRILGAAGCPRSR